MCLLDVTGEKKRQKTAVHPRSQLPQQASSHLGVHFRNRHVSPRWFAEIDFWVTGWKEEEEERRGRG